MAPPLSRRTTELLLALFEEQRRPALIESLTTEVGTNLSFCDDGTSESLERVRFAVIKLVAEHDQELESAVALAQVDWRDLLVMAGFGERLDAHMDWYEQVTRRRG